MTESLVDATNAKSPIAIVGLGCWLPGAANPRQLWEGVLARRREFRRMPDIRVPLSDYYDQTGQDTDKFHQSKVAVIEGFEFDWASYRIPESTYRRTDMSQWLALEIAHQAIKDAGFTRESVPKDRTGVFIGNTCTGEGMRSNSLRLRWPVVRRAMSKAAELHGISEGDLASFMKTTEGCYKSVFPDVNEDFVAGSISATIAGRICNYFDFHGGAFVIDGACASSLAAVITAANMLASSDLDLALAGGIDISLDPFELVGFSRNGALSRSEIRPYDRRGDGFIAGEGGGVVVLKRLSDALRDGDAVYAVLRGWGMASDGRTGIMQPAASQQAAAIRRAAVQAGYGLETLDFIEGHGTGTRAGDRTELQGLSLVMAEAGESNGKSGRTCGIGSLKSLIGHTKATAGVASLIKAVAAVNRRVIPPTAGCDEPNDAFNEMGALYPIRLGEVRSPDAILRAGVSAFGFGGINTHIIIESGGTPSPKLAAQVDERALLASHQDSELFVFGGRTREELLAHVESALADAPLLSQSDLVDLAASLADQLPSVALFRAAIVAESVDDLAAKLAELRNALQGDPPSPGMPRRGIHIASGSGAGRIGFLFPGQGSHQLLMARTLIERFDWAKQLAETADGLVQALTGQTLLDAIYRPIDRARDASELDEWTASLSATELAQPAICLASVLCARFLHSLGIRPSVVGGHSLGEITALHEAGAFDAETLLLIATLRGQAMRTASGRAGAMASLACPRAEAESLIAQVSGTVVVANLNSPNQTVVSGDSEAVDAALSAAANRNIQYRRLPVSNAFHSPLVAQGAESFEAALQPLSAPDLAVPVISGMESASIDGGTDLRRHLASQIVSPVNFIATAKKMKELCDVFIEVGPGRTLSGLCRDIFDEDTICTPIAANALAWNPNPAVAVAFVNGVGVNWREFYAKRLVRPYISPSKRVYLSNPAENPIEVKDISLPRSDASLLAGEQALEGALGQELGLDARQLSEYLRQRGEFIAGVVRLDMASSGDHAGRIATARPASTQAAQPLAPPNPAPRRARVGKLSIKDITALVVDLISTRTGYPQASITPDSRLLDDLNLDSIKAGELVAEALRRVGAAGAIDATRFANASVQAIANALHEAAPGDAPAEAVAESASQAVGGSAPVDGMAADNVIEVLFDLTSQRTGYPRSSIAADSRLLDDLNLDSIKAGELVAEASRRVGVAGAIDATRFANASLTDIAAALVEVLPVSHVQQAPSSPASPPPSSPRIVSDDMSFVSRYTTWTRNFVVRAEPTPRPDGNPTIGQAGATDLAGAVFLVFFDRRDPAPADALCAEIMAHGGRVEQAAFDAATRGALQRDSRFTHQIAVLPRVPGEGAPAARLAGMISRMISLTQAPVKSLPASRRTTVAYVQFGGGHFASEASGEEPELCNALAFARTLHLERKDLRVRVLDFAKSTVPATLAGLVLDEISGDEPFAAVGFDAELVRRVPLAVLSEPMAYRPRPLDWSEQDVVLVTGGAKGIMAECALGIARETGATLALIGRGEPAAGGDGEIARTLERFRAEGLRHVYFSCDIVDPDALAEVVGRIEAEAGAITGVVHGASVLRPSRTDNLTVDGLLQEMSPKVLGVWNLCRALDGKPLKLFVAFSSLVVDHGMPWSAGYGFANELMERIVQNAAAHSSLPLQILSFGLWGNVGRPAVLKTNDHLLSVGLHDGEIPPEEGVRRCVEAFLLDPGVQRLCVYGRSVGYAPWDMLRPRPAVPANLRFIEQVLHMEPDVELIARCHLTLQRDRYLHDHVYNGMYIVPTVLALESIAQAAVALVGDGLPLRGLDAIEMPYPIVVDPSHGLAIELRAEVQPVATPDGLRRINVSVSTEQSAFKTRVLSGTAVLGPRQAMAREPIALDGPVPINARADLYGRQFFVGPLYQRMGDIYSVAPQESICVGEIHADRTAAREAFSDSVDDRLVLGDPFFRDTLLHTSLLHHLDHMAFTARIDKIEFFEGCGVAQDGERVCVSRLQWSGGKDAEYQLVAAAPDGRIFERWTGFCSKALARAETWPALQDLLDTDRARAQDERSLSRLIADAAGQLGVVAPSVALECLSGFSDLPAEERHAREQALCARGVALAVPGATPAPSLQWLPNGRPHLDTRADIDVSFSHEGWYCLCVVGSGAQGCDLAALPSHGRSDWRALLGSARAPLLEALGAKDSPDIAGTRIWAALEAARKALGTDDEELTIIQRVESGVLFQARTLDKETFILTLPVRFSHGPHSIVALTVGPPTRAQAASGASDTPAVPTVRIVRDERLGCDVLEHEFSVNWKECTSLSRKVMAASYIEWFHRTREAMLSPQNSRRWVAGVVDGTAGLVARKIRVRLRDEATAHDELCGRIWMTQLLESGAKWRVDFYKKLPEGQRKLVATVEAEGGMVETSRGGSQSRTVLNAMRDYGRFVQTRPLAEEAGHGGDFNGLQPGRPVFEAPPGPRGGPLLFAETMRPSLIDSDLVGNVSSITFFAWLAHTRDRFLHSIVPREMMRRVGGSSKGFGEALCFEEEMVYLREAFPFDDIVVEMKLIAATERGIRLRYEFVRTRQEASEKVAFGHQQLLWVHRDENGNPHSQNFPAKLLESLLSFQSAAAGEAPQQVAGAGR